jgi:hypothetical protein
MNASRDNDRNGPGRPVTSLLHPLVYAIVIALAGWLVLSIWLFAGSGVVDYLLFIVSGFIFIAVALPLILSRVGRGGAPKSGKPQSFHEWAEGDFDTPDDRLTGIEATTQILLPIAAVAFGMTIFGIALHIAEHSVS